MPWESELAIQRNPQANLSLRDVPNNMKKFLLLTISVVLIAAACNKQAAVSPSPTPTPTSTETSKNVYENANMKVTLQDGWTAKQAGSNVAAVNITNDNYILYINTQAQQASGVEGGRFAEIAQGAPSADAVVTVQPSPPCGITESHDNRVDWYISDKTNVSYCKIPTNGQTVWYFSYITDSSKGYFNYYTPGQGKALVVTMSYNSKNINSFPVKGSQELESALSEMTTMVNSLEVKIK
jgi:hypothetical protein